ncbi:MAG: hypothetical protein ACOYT4_05220 [Nanoarchaeota archaeon]
MIQQFQNCIKFFSDLILAELPAVCWIAGGALRDYFTIGRCSSDIDIFFPSEKEFKKAIKFFKIQNILPTFSNERVTNYIWKKNKIQLVSAHYFSSPEETIEKFDFTVVCCAVDKENVSHHETFFMDLAKRRLVINSLPYPLSTLQRLQKYIKKGYTICNGGLLEIAKAIQKVNLENSTENPIEFYLDGSVRFIRID